MFLLKSILQYIMHGEKKKFNTMNRSIQFHYKKKPNLFKWQKKKPMLAWYTPWLNKIKIIDWCVCINQRLPGACNRSSGSKLLSITTQLHCGSHLGGRARLPDTILEEDHQMTIPSKFGSNWATGSRQDGFYVNFP